MPAERLYSHMNHGMIWYDFNKFITVVYGVCAVPQAAIRTVNTNVQKITCKIFGLNWRLFGELNVTMSGNVKSKTIESGLIVSNFVSQASKTLLLLFLSFQLSLINYFLSHFLATKNKTLNIHSLAFLIIIMEGFFTAI